MSLLPLAQASPLDQTWLGGFYDDDIVLIVLSDVAVLEGITLREDGPLLVVVASAPPDAESPRPLLELSSSPPRAPPVA